MSTTLQHILALLLVAGVFVLTRLAVGWKMKRAAAGIVGDLRRRGALDFHSAVDLEYAKPQWLRLGLRDYRPKALQALVQHGVVGLTESGKYYLARDLEFPPGGKPT